MQFVTKFVRRLYKIKRIGLFCGQNRRLARQKKISRAQKACHSAPSGEESHIAQSKFDSRVGTIQSANRINAPSSRELAHTKCVTEGVVPRPPVKISSDIGGRMKASAPTDLQ